MAVTFEKAVRKAIKAYVEGLSPDALRKASPKKAKYNKKYFDKVGTENGIEPVGKKLEKEKKNG